MCVRACACTNAFVRNAPSCVFPPFFVSFHFFFFFFKETLQRESVHVWDVTLAVGTTQQPVQRPVCIITACPAARDRQTRLRALSCKTQTSHPNAGRPRPSPAQRRDSETAKQTPANTQKWQTQGENSVPEKTGEWMQNQKQHV